MSLFIFLYFGLLKLPKEAIVVSNHGVLPGEHGLVDASCLIHLGEHLSPHKSLYPTLSTMNYSSERNVKT